MTLATNRRNDEAAANRLVNHMFVKHTLPYIEDMLKEHAK